MKRDAIKAVNEITRYLAVRDIKEMSHHGLKDKFWIGEADVILVLGCDLPYVTQKACELYKEKFGNRIMFCGGVGHSTTNLKEKVSRILDVAIEELPESEAEVYAYLAKQKYEIPEFSMLLDTKSTNTAENIKNAISILNEREIVYRNIILMQDPLLQRRSYVTAKDMFPEHVNLINYAPFVPELDGQGKLKFQNSFLWDEQRFYELILGEIWRLRDNETGYGPRGTGFISHVEIPKEVDAAFDYLAKEMPEYLGRCK